MPSKTRRFTLPIVSAMSTAFLVHGCGRDTPRQVCVDAADTRVQDINCTWPNTRYRWYYYPAGGGGGAAGIGSRAFGGGYVSTPGASYSAAPAEGVARGGFGLIGRAFGGGEGGGEGGGGE